MVDSWKLIFIEEKLTKIDFIDEKSMEIYFYQLMLKPGSYYNAQNVQILRCIAIIWLILFWACWKMIIFRPN